MLKHYKARSRLLGTWLTSRRFTCSGCFSSTGVSSMTIGIGLVTLGMEVNSTKMTGSTSIYPFEREVLDVLSALGGASASLSFMP